ncbi:hypothetical protein [Candidatus Williamhamiltonella defendens]|uniref:hypothetical protein n=1 Tax=Candidatus Williamhamiltonella defendens TaxID=138072 RepID=UPI00130DD07B|nr:hypothetical protein [Candidatus Hamiltonella defensa]
MGGLKDALEVTETDIWLPNPAADYDDYVLKAKVVLAHFKVIRNLDTASSQFLLVKSTLRCGDRKKFAGLISFDLVVLGNYFKVLSAGESNLKIFDEI